MMRQAARTALSKKRKSPSFPAGSVAGENRDVQKSQHFRDFR